MVTQRKVRLEMARVRVVPVTLEVKQQDKHTAKWKVIESKEGFALQAASGNDWLSLMGELNDLPETRAFFTGRNPRKRAISFAEGRGHTVVNEDE